MDTCQGELRVVGRSSPQHRPGELQSGAPGLPKPLTAHTTPPCAPPIDGVLMFSPLAGGLALPPCYFLRLSCSMGMHLGVMYPFRLTRLTGQSLLGVSEGTLDLEF